MTTVYVDFAAYACLLTEAVLLMTICVRITSKSIGLVRLLLFKSLEIPDLRLLST